MRATRHGAARRSARRAPAIQRGDDDGTCSRPRSFSWPASPSSSRTVSPGSVPEPNPADRQRSTVELLNNQTSTGFGSRRAHLCPVRRIPIPALPAWSYDLAGDPRRSIFVPAQASPRHSHQQRGEHPDAEKAHGLSFYLSTDTNRRPSIPSRPDQPRLWPERSSTTRSSSTAPARSWQRALRHDASARIRTVPRRAATGSGMGSISATNSWKAMDPSRPEVCSKTTISR